MKIKFILLLALLILPMQLLFAQAFDYSLSLTRTEGTVAKGGFIRTGVIVTLISGTAQQISLSGQCPPAAICTYNPNTGLPRYTSGLIIHSVESTPTGTYDLTIRGTAPDGTVRTTTYKVNVIEGAGEEINVGPAYYIELALALLSLMLMLLLVIAILAYLFGLATNNAGLIAYAKDRMFYVIIAAIISITSTLIFDTVISPLLGADDDQTILGGCLPGLVCLDIVDGDSGSTGGSGGGGGTSCPPYVFCGPLDVCSDADNDGICDPPCPPGYVPLSGGGCAAELTLICPPGQICTDSASSADSVGSALGEYASSVGLALMLVVVLIALAYMVGTATNNANLLIFAKDELFHLSITIAIILSIGGLLAFSTLAITNFMDFTLSNLLDGQSDCYQPGKAPNTIARCYISRLEAKARTALESTTKQSINTEIESATNFGFYNPWSGGIMTPLSGEKKAHSMQFDMIGLTFILPALISIMIQKIFLNLGMDLVQLFLLPIAIFFRVLPGFRPMGNLLLALSIAFYIFIPSMYAVNAAMDEVIFESAKLGCTPGSETEELVQDEVLGSCNTPYNFWAIARLLPQAFFLPNLTIAITITFLSGINKALKVLT